jgi:hypothetical protein
MFNLIVMIVCTLFFGALHAKSPMLLYVNSPKYIEGAGMFHNFNIVLGCLELYDTHDHIGIKVDFGEEGLYYEESHGPNWWNYYFEPINYTSREYSKKRPLIKRLRDDEKGEIGNGAHFYMKRERAHELIEHYICVRKEFLEEVEAFYHEYLEGSFIIGVHYRGSDKWLEAIHVSYEETLSKIENEIAVQEDCKIFVATDDPSFLEEIKKHFGEKVYYIDAQRLKDKPVHYYSKERFLNGKEALLDCLLLAKSDVLIRTNSNLSAVSAYFNPQMRVINLNTLNDVLYDGMKKRGVPNELNAK